MWRWTKNRIARILLMSYILGFSFMFGSLFHEIQLDKTELANAATRYSALDANYSKLEADYADLQSKYDEQLAKEEEMTQTISDLQTIPKVKSNYGVTKTWMSYRTIASPSQSSGGWASPQWKLQQNAYTDKEGFRKVDDYYCIAIGFGWGYEIGDTVLVVLSGGNSFKAVMGDEKALEHTDAATHKVHLSDKSVVEFIIDPDVMDSYYSRIVGIQAMPEFSGSVVGIYKLGKIDI